MGELQTLSDLKDDVVYTPKQIAEMLRAPPRTIANAFRKGELAGIELGPRTIRITGRAVREWLDSKKPNTSSDALGDPAETSRTDNGASTSNEKVKNVSDLVLASL